MKENLPTVTIGISAFNEEANIAQLIDKILWQKIKRFNLEKILIISDGSDDNTVIETKKSKSKRVEVVDHKDRQGIAVRYNEILKKSTSDILIILDADVSLQGRRFVEKLISPILQNQADLVSSCRKELPPVTFFEKVISISCQMARKVFESWRNGDNLYTCKGTARAFSKKLYKKIKFNKSVAQDIYSYFFCKVNGFKYQYAGDAVVFYRPPLNLFDHQKQSLRFLNSLSMFDQEFGSDFTKQEFNIPSILKLSALVKFFLKFPVHISFYLLIYLYMRLRSKFAATKSTQIWDMVKSSKTLKR